MTPRDHDKDDVVTEPTVESVPTRAPHTPLPKRIVVTQEGALYDPPHKAWEEALPLLPPRDVATLTEQQAPVTILGVTEGDRIDFHDSEPEVEPDATPTVLSGNERDEPGMPVPDAVTWEVINVVDSTGEFYDRAHLRREAPELVLVSPDGTTAVVALTPKVARHMRLALHAVDNIYSGKPAVDVKMPSRKPISRLNSFLTWWGDHKIKGTIGAILFAGIGFSVISGAFVMVTA